MIQKLTPPQAALLAELPTTCSDGYPPARMLVRLGLARWEVGKYGGSTLHPTEDGLRHKSKNTPRDVM